MTPQEERNQKLAERIIKNLNRRNMEAFYCLTGKEAVKKVSDLQLRPLPAEQQEQGAACRSACR